MEARPGDRKITHIELWRGAGERLALSRAFGHRWFGAESLSDLGSDGLPVICHFARRSVGRVSVSFLDFACRVTLD